MDARTPPAPDLQPLLDQVRAAHRRQPPDYRQRMDDLARLAAMVRRYTDDLVRAVSADFGRRSHHETRVADVMVTLQEIAHLRRHLKGWMRPARRGLNWAFLPARAEVRQMPIGFVGIVGPG